MRQIAISVLALFVVLPAFADVRLPVVNLSSGGVSARAAFGEPIVKEVKQDTIVVSNAETKAPVADVKTEKVAAAENTNRGVISRSASVQSSGAESIDVGAQLADTSDILMPHRPSSDLWAHSYSDVVPLRLPSPQEFSVFRSDNVLPEESLDEKPKLVASADVDNAASSNIQTRSATLQNTSATLSEIDAQIAKLNELQRRADESVQENVRPRRVVSRSVVARPAVVETEKNTVKESQIARADGIKNTSEEEINLSRVVVPMNDLVDDEDVVVRSVQRAESPRIASVRNDMTQMTPSELRKAFRKTFLSENKHLSTFQIDDRFDVASDMTVNAEGFTSERDLSETGGIRPLEIKIKFRNDDAALSRDNYNLLTEYAGIVLSNPTRAVQVAIPQSVVLDSDERKLAARRLAIVEQVLRDNGVSEQRILPVLSQRDDEGLVLRMISLDQYETLTKQQRDIFGDTVSKKTYRSMSW